MTKDPASSRKTIVDVAKKAGVSLGTASRVINKDTHVAPETRERVEKVMRELGYVANRQARSLKGSKTNVIGVLVPDLGTGYIGEIMRGIDSELALTQLDLMLFTTHRTAIKEAGYVANLVQGMVDGLLIVLPRNPADYTGTLTRRNFPFVLIDHQGTGEACPAVGAANWQGAYDATEFLIKIGHQRIGFISGSMDLGAAIDRLDGYRSALRTHHLSQDTELIYGGEFFQPDGYAGAGALLQLTNPPTAIFASNDVMAMGAMDAARSCGLRIPGRHHPISAVIVIDRQLKEHPEPGDEEHHFGSDEEDHAVAQADIDDRRVIARAAFLDDVEPPTGAGEHQDQRADDEQRPMAVAEEEVVRVVRDAAHQHHRADRQE